MSPKPSRSTRALTDASGSLTDSYSYTAFGDLFAQTGSTANSYLFTGQQYDAATGLYSMRARYYDPAVGRFLTQDTYPVDYSNPLELNRYVYVANNPVNSIDPSGHTLVEVVGNLRQSVRQAITGGTLAPVLQLAYARAILAIYRATPLLTGAICIFIPLISNSDVSPACDSVPLDDITNLFSKGIRQILRALPGGGNPLEAAANLARTLARLPETPGGREGGKNIAIAVLSINDNIARWIWGVSGHGCVTRHVEDTIEELSQVGAQVDKVARNLANTILQVSSDHAEAKVLEHILLNNLDNLPANSRIRLTLYTEIQPCPGCGGVSGLGGAFQTFYDIITRRGHHLDIDLIWTHPYGPSGG